MSRLGLASIRIWLLSDCHEYTAITREQTWSRSFMLLVSVICWRLELRIKMLGQALLEEQNQVQSWAFINYWQTIKLVSVTSLGLRTAGSLACNPILWGSLWTQPNSIHSNVARKVNNVNCQSSPVSTSKQCTINQCTSGYLCLKVFFDSFFPVHVVAKWILN